MSRKTVKTVNKNGGTHILDYKNEDQNMVVNYQEKQKLSRVNAQYGIRTEYTNGEDYGNVEDKESIAYTYYVSVNKKLDYLSSVEKEDNYDFAYRRATNYFTAAELLDGLKNKKKLNLEKKVEQANKKHLEALVQSALLKPIYKGNNNLLEPINWNKALWSDKKIAKMQHTVSSKTLAAMSKKNIWSAKGALAKNITGSVTGATGEFLFKNFLYNPIRSGIFNSTEGVNSSNLDLLKDLGRTTTNHLSYNLIYGNALKKMFGSAGDFSNFSALGVQLLFGNTDLRYFTPNVYTQMLDGLLSGNYMDMIPFYRAGADLYIVLSKYFEKEDFRGNGKVVDDDVPYADFINGLKILGQEIGLGVKVLVKDLLIDSVTKLVLNTFYGEKRYARVNKYFDGVFFDSLPDERHKANTPTITQISTGSGHDTINVTAAKSIIKSGLGNDVVKLESKTYIDSGSIKYKRILKRDAGIDLYHTPYKNEIDVNRGALYFDYKHRSAHGNIVGLKQKVDDEFKAITFSAPSHANFVDNENAYGGEVFLKVMKSATLVTRGVSGVYDLGGGDDTFTLIGSTEELVRSSQKYKELVASSNYGHMSETHGKLRLSLDRAAKDSGLLTHFNKILIRDVESVVSSLLQDTIDDYDTSKLQIDFINSLTPKIENLFEGIAIHYFAPLPNREKLANYFYGQYMQDAFRQMVENFIRNIDFQSITDKYVGKLVRDRHLYNVDATKLSKINAVIDAMNVSGVVSKVYQDLDNQPIYQEVSDLSSHVYKKTLVYESESMKTVNDESWDFFHTAEYDGYYDVVSTFNHWATHKSGNNPDDGVLSATNYVLDININNPRKEVPLDEYTVLHSDVTNPHSYHKKISQGEHLLLNEKERQKQKSHAFSVVGANVVSVEEVNRQFKYTGENSNSDSTFTSDKITSSNSHRVFLKKGDKLYVRQRETLTRSETALLPNSLQARKADKYTDISMNSPSLSGTVVNSPSSGTEPNGKPPAVGGVVKASGVKENINVVDIGGKRSNISIDLDRMAMYEYADDDKNMKKQAYELNESSLPNQVIQKTHANIEVKVEASEGKIDLGSGDDSARIENWYGEITAGDGNDQVSANNIGYSLKKQKNIIDLGRGDDSFWGQDILLPVFGGGGKDMISIHGAIGDVYGDLKENFTLKHNQGFDDRAASNRIHIDNSKVYKPTSNHVWGGNEFDAITIVGASGMSIWGRGGNDSIEIEKSTVTVGGGLGNDVIIVKKSQAATVSGGRGNDTIFVQDSMYTQVFTDINPNAAFGELGQDVISSDNSWDVVHIDSSYGTKISLMGHKAEVNLIDADHTEITTTGHGRTISQVYIEGGSGSAKLGDWDDFVVINETTKPWEIDGPWKIDGGGGNDFFHVQEKVGSRSQLYGGGGNDFFHVQGGRSQLYGGGGNDTFILNSDNGDYSSNVNTGAGSDIILMNQKEARLNASSLSSTDRILFMGTGDNNTLISSWQDYNNSIDTADKLDGSLNTVYNGHLFYQDSDFISIDVKSFDGMELRLSSDDSDVRFSVYIDYGTYQLGVATDVKHFQANYATPYLIKVHRANKQGTNEQEEYTNAINYTLHSVITQDRHNHYTLGPRQEVETVIVNERRDLILQEAKFDSNKYINLNLDRNRVISGRVRNNYEHDTYNIKLNEGDRFKAENVAANGWGMDFVYSVYKVDTGEVLFNSNEQKEYDFVAYESGHYKVRISSNNQSQSNSINGESFYRLSIKNENAPQDSYTNHYHETDFMYGRSFDNAFVIETSDKFRGSLEHSDDVNYMKFWADPNQTYSFILQSSQVINPSLRIYNQHGHLVEYNTTNNLLSFSANDYGHYYLGVHVGRSGIDNGYGSGTSGDYVIQAVQAYQMDLYNHEHDFSTWGTYYDSHTLPFFLTLGAYGSLNGFGFTDAYDMSSVSNRNSNHYKFEMHLNDSDSRYRDGKYFKTNLLAGQSLLLDIDQMTDTRGLGIKNGWVKDTVLELYDQNHNLIAMNDDDSYGRDTVSGRHHDSYLEHTATYTGTYYFRVRTYANVSTNGNDKFFLKVSKNRVNANSHEKYFDGSLYSRSGYDIDNNKFTRYIFSESESNEKSMTLKYFGNNRAIRREKMHISIDSNIATFEITSLERPNHTWYSQEINGQSVFDWSSDLDESLIITVKAKDSTISSGSFLDVIYHDGYSDLDELKASVQPKDVMISELGDPEYIPGELVKSGKRKMIIENFQDNADVDVSATYVSDGVAEIDNLASQADKSFQETPAPPTNEYISSNTLKRVESERTSHYDNLSSQKRHGEKVEALKQAKLEFDQQVKKENEFDSLEQQKIDLEKEIKEKVEELDQAKKLKEEQDKKIAEQDKKIAEQDKKIAEQDKKIAEQYKNEVKKLEEQKIKLENKLKEKVEVLKQAKLGFEQDESGIIDKSSPDYIKKKYNPILSTYDDYLSA